MSPQSFVEQLHKNYLLFDQQFKQLSNDKMQKKPNPGVWSIAENIEHIIKVNASYFSVFTAIAEGTYVRPFVSRLPLVTKKFGTMILKAVSRNREKKMKTFPLWEPSQSNFQEPLSHLLENHQTIGTLVLGITPQIQRGVVIASPASKMIVYSVDDALTIIIEHELRHLEQAKELLRQL
jgi:hypothetical protein